MGTKLFETNPGVLKEVEYLLMLKFHDISIGAENEVGTKLSTSVHLKDKQILCKTWGMMSLLKAYIYRTDMGKIKLLSLEVRSQISAIDMSTVYIGRWHHICDVRVHILNMHSMELKTWAHST